MKLGILILSDLVSYSEDDSKLKQLTLLIEQLIKDSQQKRKFLDQETTDTLTNQVCFLRISILTELIVYVSCRNLEAYYLLILIHLPKFLINRR